ncbi:MAG TPA: hypothetical protein VF527_09220 [Pyrinomonadaceae bacterium]|jgi:energy-coupling factor transporter transmembrane protein EcfT
MANRETKDESTQATGNDLDTDGKQPLKSSKHSPTLLNVYNTLGALISMASIVVFFSPSGPSLKVFFFACLAFLASLLYWRAINEYCKPIWLLIPFIIVSAFFAYKVVEPPVQAPTQDVWALWTEQVSKEVAECAEEDEHCLARAIAIPYPSPDSAAPLAKLYADTRAGFTIMRLRGVEKMLKTRVGIVPAFTGAGFAVPNDPDRVYWKARIPEYLVRNHTDDVKEVWSWQLDTTKLQLTVDQLIREEPLIQRLQSRNRQELIDSVEANCSLTDLTPAVIRFSRFQQLLYKNRLALEERKRVFVMHLCAVRHLTLEQAAYLSGYQLTPNTKRDPKYGEDKLFVWVYIPPGNVDDVMTPTWEYILPNLKNWLLEK